MSRSTTKGPMVCKLALVTTVYYVLVRVKGFANRNRLKPLHHPARSDPLEIEHRHHSKILIGSDDSGGGCIAGPIVCVSCHVKALLPMPIQDCKKLSLDECRRIHQWVLYDHPDTVTFTAAIRSNREIDESGIQNCLQEAFRESIENLVPKLGENPENLYGIVDGHRYPGKVSIRCRPWIKADEMVYTVAVASILARAIHSDFVKQATKDYPEYCYDQHGGYSTKLHIEKLHRYGVSPLHRLSCKPVRDRMNTEPLDKTRRLGMLAVMTSVMLGRPSPSLAASLVSLPEEGEIEAAVPRDWTGIDNPINDMEFPFSRLDTNKDDVFYKESRFVEHVDEQAVARMVSYIDEIIQPTTQSVLDVGCSWTSHVADTHNVSLFAGIGMNEEELKANSKLTEWKVRDLNENPVLSYPDNTFDVILCQLSIDYFTQPIQLCREMARVLKPNGTVHILFSNRLFLSKAVALWTGKDDIDHTFIVASYLRFCGSFRDIAARDLSVRKKKKIVGDPLYVVTASKA